MSVSKYYASYLSLQIFKKKLKHESLCFKNSDQYFITHDKKIFLSFADIAIIADKSPFSPGFVESRFNLDYTLPVVAWKLDYPWLD